MFFSMIYLLIKESADGVFIMLCLCVWARCAATCFINIVMAYIIIIIENWQLFLIRQFPVT